jgi:transcriptional regulator with GAF, ATPase, and Fis domain
MMTGKRKAKKESHIPVGSKAGVMKRLWDISQSLYQHINIDDLILNIIKQMKEVMEAEGVSVILHDGPKNEFVFCWAESDPNGLVTKLKEIRFPEDKGIAGGVFKSGKAELISNIDKDPRHYKEIDYSTGFKTSSMIAAPLQKKDKAIGVLEVLNKKKGIFDQEDITFVTTLTPIIAMALDNARMYAELDEAYKKLQAIDREKDKLLRYTTEENILLRREIEKRFSFEEIIGNSKVMVDLFKLCEKVIDLDITVLIEGETGTGKELIARCIHYNSPRKNRAFVSQNCGGIPETLLTSELFGHKKGSFTGAVADKKGLFEIADGGTIFLDEVGEMSPAMQTSLLRVLQNGEIRPLGADYHKTVDTRVISATNRNLEEEVAKGKFREDLIYRLNVFTIKVPPLRERTGDIRLLANHFAKKYSQKIDRPAKALSPEALQCLETYPFPGNVRELENEIERAVALAQDVSLIEVSHLSEKIEKKSMPVSSEVEMKGTLKEMVVALEKSVLTQALEKHGGNRTRVAGELGLSRYGLMKKLQRYGF